MYRILLLTLCIFGLSCKKYLDKQSDTSEAIPTTIADLQGMMDDANHMNEYATPSYGEASADDYFLPDASYISMRQTLQETYTWTPYYYVNSTDWTAAYHPVYNANYCLETLPSIPRTPSNQSQWDNVKGSALFFRSLEFLGIAWNYARPYDSATASSDPGIPLRLTSDFNVKSKRGTLQQTYDRIIEDARASIDYLPDLPVHPYRPSKAAAYGLLARAWLSMRVYDSAFWYANLALGITSYLLDYNDPSVNLTGSIGFKPFNGEIIFYSSLSTFGLTIQPYSARADTVLYDSYDTNDLRKKAFFTLVSGYPRFKGSYSASGAKLFSGIATDELYLIRAECYARRGNVTQAMNDLNTLLQKRWDHAASFVPLTASSAPEALDLVLQERRKELIFRGLRWPDIKRLNLEGRNIVPERLVQGNLITLQPNANRYALPLPSDIIDMTGMPQNPE